MAARSSHHTSPLSDPLVLVATAGGVGYSPRAPGTCGALLGLGWTALLDMIASPLLRAGGIVAGIALGVWVCGRAAKRLERKDPSAVIWDEIATMPLVFWGLSPLGELSWITIAAGFLLHRLFDISKLFPARSLEALPGGWGIMADDCVAAGYAAGALRLLLWLGANWS